MDLDKGVRDTRYFTDNLEEQKMSAGGFSNVKYEAATGIVHPIQIQPETASLEIGGETNSVAPVAAGTVQSKISARVSGSRRSLGLHSRLVSVQFGETAGAAPDGYKGGSPIALPWLQKDTFELISRGDTGNYLGKVVTVTGTTAEVAR